MSEQDRYPDWLVLISVLAAFVLTLVELPDFLAATRPALVLVVAIYWTLAMPQYFGLFTAWFLGLTLDVLTGSLLGQHAVAMLIPCYAAARLRDTLRMFPLWQQCAMLIPLVAIYEFILFWIDGISHRDAETHWRWIQIVSSSVFWAMLFFILTPFRTLAARH